MSVEELDVEMVLLCVDFNHMSAKGDLTFTTQSILLNGIHMRL